MNKDKLTAFDRGTYDACTAAITDYFAKNSIAELNAENARLREKYDELVYHVATVYLGETRHQTALRYIKEAEKGSDTAYEEQALGGQQDE